MSGCSAVCRMNRSRKAKRRRLGWNPPANGARLFSWPQGEACQWLACRERKIDMLTSRNFIETNFRLSRSMIAAGGSDNDALIAEAIRYLACHCVPEAR